MEPNHHLSQGLVLAPHQGEKLMRRWGHPFLIKIDPLNGGAQQFAVGAETLAPGKLVHSHKHDYFEELLFITAGNGMALLGEKEFPVEAGSLIFIPQKVWHGVRNTGTKEIELIWVFPQLGMDQYFRATSVPAGEKYDPLSEEEMNAIRATHMQNVEYQEKTLSSYTKQK